MLPWAPNSLPSYTQIFSMYGTILLYIYNEINLNHLYHSVEAKFSAALYLKFFLCTKLFCYMFTAKSIRIVSIISCGRGCRKLAPCCISGTNSLIRRPTIRFSSTCLKLKIDSISSTKKQKKKKKKEIKIYSNFN